MTALHASYASALHVADSYPQYRTQIVAAAQQSLVDGALAAYAVGAVAILVGAEVVLFALPSHDREHAIVEDYCQQDAARATEPARG